MNLAFSTLIILIIFSSILTSQMKKSLLNKHFILGVLTLCSLFFVSCSEKGSVSPVVSTPQSRGQVLSTTFLATYSASTLQNLFNASVGTSQYGIVLQHAVNIYKVLYVTTDPKGNLVQASGALYIPEGMSNLSLISFHHGTISQRSQAPSADPISNSVGLLFAALGYFALEPDYLGFGESNIQHPYLYKKTSALTVIDFIRAGRSVAASKRVALNSQVFLAGYSEGGYVTLAAQKEIEQNYKDEINITASAPMAGSYDLNLTANEILQNKTYNEPGYVAFIFLAYNNIYDWNRLNDIFTASYSGLIPPLFDGTKNLDQINAFLTTDLTKLLNQSFVASFQSGKETAITDAFIANSLLDWTPTSNTRLYHGDADEIVPYQNSVEARDYFNSHGANIDLVTISGGTHDTSSLPSIIAAINWFGSIHLSKTFASD